MQSNIIHEQPNKSQRSSLLNHQGLWVSLFFIALIHFLIVSTIASGRFDIKPSRLILKQDSCDLVREYGIPTELHGTDECRITVPYEASAFGTHGKIHINGLQIRLSEDQVVVVGSLGQHIWTSEDKLFLGWLIFSAAFLIGLTLLMLRSLKREVRS